MLYTYCGPVFDKNDRELEYINRSSDAVSPQKALANIRYRLMKDKYHQLVYLDPQYLTSSDDVQDLPSPVEQSDSVKDINPDYDFEETDDNRTWWKF